MNLTESDILSLIREVMSPVIAPGAHDFLDDGAELPACPPAYTRVVSMDAFQEDHDFKVGLGPLDSAGYRAIVQNLSDMAAMGAEPVGFMWSLEVPASWLSKNLSEFCGGALKACQRYGLGFYGGDLSASLDKFRLSITIFGDVAGKPLNRRGAKPGDKIYLSRPLGDAAAAGYHSIYPVPELELGAKLVGHATACMDISDGLGKDLYRICKASKVGAKLHTVPIATGATLEQALYGGEDYALLFTAPSSVWGIEIGEVVEGSCVSLNGQNLAEKGYDHFGTP